MPEPHATPRRFPRVKLLGNVTGEVSFLQDVTLLDLCEGGARLEYAGRFALGAVCFLRLAAPEGELVLKARVIHSTVSRKVPVPAGEPTLLFHSGVEFVGPRRTASSASGSSSPGSERARRWQRCPLPGLAQSSGR